MSKSRNINIAGSPLFVLFQIVRQLKYTIGDPAFFKRYIVIFINKFSELPHKSPKFGMENEIQFLCQLHSKLSTKAFLISRELQLE